MKWFLAALAVTLGAQQAHALRNCDVMQFYTQAALEASNQRDCTIAYALDNDVYFVRAAGAWVGLSTLASITGDNGGTFANSTNNEWRLVENSENLDMAFGTNTLTLSSTTGVATLLTAFDLSLSGGAGALTLTDSASSMVLPDNDTTALLVGSTGLLNLLTLDTGDNTETVIVTGTTAATAFHVDTGLALVDELLTVGGGAGALTLTNTAASVLTIDNDASALDIGSAGMTAGLRYVSSDNTEHFLFGAGMAYGDVDVTGAATLDASDCGKAILVTAAHDGNTITLPALTAVPAGCVYRFHYVGADAGALLDITPNASDGIEGGCTLAASVVNFSGTDDADIGLTKATIQKGDTLTLTSGDPDDWYASAIQGICANN